ncbi:sensor histidine kinase [Geobacter sp. DSM 9736]|uniref:sensor histidine kinase n=1 Tax=Geobacter sp. DSM 9736 TaxID=1277350 RepID=UPI0018D2E1FF|nr:sensor histidine kinase [Geobacter sp. DSM 9736]
MTMMSGIFDMMARGGMFRLFTACIRRNLLILAGILALPAVGIAINDVFSERRESIAQAQADSERLAVDIASEMENLVAGAQQLASALAQSSEIRNQDQERTELILRKIRGLNPQYVNLAVSDRTGRLWASAAPRRSPVSVADRRYFKNASATRRFSSGEFGIGRTFRKPTINFGYPMEDRIGELEGIISLNFDLDFFRDLLKRSGLPPGSMYAITDHRGTIISRGIAPAAYVGKPLDLTLFRHIKSDPDKSQFTGSGLDGATEFFISHRKLFLAGETDPYVYIVSGIPVDAVVQKANKALLLKLSVLVPFILAALLVVLLIAKFSIIDRISALEATSQRIAAGDLEVRVPEFVKGGELGEFAAAFDFMAASLAEDMRRRESAEAALAEKQHQLEELNCTLEGRIAEAVAEIRQKDQALIQQSRQAAMGEMITYIGHQWKQPLNNIALLVQTLGVKYELDQASKDDVKSTIERTLENIGFMSRTIDDFRNFLRYDKEKKTFVVNELVGWSLNFISPSFSSCGISVDLKAEGEFRVIGYPNEFIQVLLNILNNARDIFLERDVRDPQVQIVISSENNRSVVAIRDNGGGIPEEILPMIFQPYFTTKKEGSGTGIGLYMSKVIIEKNMNGSLTARNVGNGAEFRIEI